MSRTIRKTEQEWSDEIVKVLKEIEDNEG